MKRNCKSFLLVLVALAGLAQEPVVARVSIPLIANRSQHQAASITVESLVVTDQKVPVTRPTLLRGADLPIELGILIDASRSERDAHLDEIVKATKQFAEGLIRGPEDRVFFLQFADDSKASGWLNKDKLQEAKLNIGIGGGTALYDALAMACRQRMGSRDWNKPTRRILILISDGDDNLSHITRDQAASEALRAGTVIFTINTGSSGMALRGERVMESFAKLTGGESFSQVSRGEGTKVLANISNLINGMYYLSYVPPDASKAAIHDLDVKPAPEEKFELTYARKYFWNP